MYESELERAHGQMLEEMQAMEDEKNRAIEEAFSRAQVEMKAVHENLAGEEGVGLVGFVGLGLSIVTHARVVPTGVRTNLLTLQPALRTLTHDYNSLKRQVRDFPLLLQETLRSARAEVSSGLAPLPPPTPLHTLSLLPTWSSGSARGSLSHRPLTQIGQAIEEVNNTNRELLRKYRRELQLRKKCHNELVRLKGAWGGG